MANSPSGPAKRGGKSLIIIAALITAGCALAALYGPGASPLRLGVAMAEAAPPAVSGLPQVQALSSSLSPEVRLAAATEFEGAWQRGDWQKAITSLTVLMAAEPRNPEWSDRLSQAHANLGWALLAEHKLQEAEEQFDLALQIKPAAPEAVEGLRQVREVAAAPPPAPRQAAADEDMTCYVVHRGDTLFRLALRFQTTVEAIKAANHLSSNRILAGQKLLIPTGRKAVCMPECPTPCPPVACGPVPVCPTPCPSVVCVSVCSPPCLPVACVPICPSCPLVCVLPCPPPPNCIPVCLPAGRVAGDP